MQNKLLAVRQSVHPADVLSIVLKKRELIHHMCIYIFIKKNATTGAAAAVWPRHPLERVRQLGGHRCPPSFFFSLSLSFSFPSFPFLFFPTQAHTLNLGGLVRDMLVLLSDSVLPIPIPSSLV